MRIKSIYAHICFMKAKLNLTIDENLLAAMKAYANKQQTSLSELVENYFKSLNKPKRKNIISLVDKLEAPDLGKTANLIDLYYKEQAKKYGF